MSWSPPADPLDSAGPAGREELGTKAVFLNRFYWPDVAATAQMLTDLAEDLAAAGWAVTVVTSRSGYAARPGALPREETRNGVRILRVGPARPGFRGTLGRAVDQLGFLSRALLRSLRLPRPDVFVAMSDPPFLLAAALLAGKVRGVPTVYWVQDLYPQLAARLGVLRERGVPYRLLNAVARRLHAACDGVVALGPRMSEALVTAGARPEHTTYVHNWADARLIGPVDPERNPFLRRHGLEEKFVVMYSGNAGRAHVFDAVLDAMRLLRDDPSVVFVFIGGGSRLPEIRAAAEREGIDNVRFIGYLPREELPCSLSAASVSLVTEDPAAAGLLVPSKTYGILASARPLLFVGSPESDVAALVREVRCGIVVPHDDPASLVRALERLRADPVLAASMGARGRRAAETLFERGRSTRLWRQRVMQILRSARAVPPGSPNPDRPQQSQSQ